MKSFQYDSASCCSSLQQLGFPPQIDKIFPSAFCNRGKSLGFRMKVWGLNKGVVNLVFRV